jgi:hypothetical protein
MGEAAAMEAKRSSRGNATLWSADRLNCCIFGSNQSCFSSKGSGYGVF